MDRRIEILLCAPYGGVPGGISRWTEHIVKYYESLSDTDIGLSVLPMGRSVFVNINSSLWFRLRYNIKDYLKIFKAYSREMCSGKHYDVVHLTSSASWSLIKDIYILRKARARHLKTVVHFRFGRIPELSEKRNWEWKLLNRVLRLADCAIVIDRASCETLRSVGFMHVVNVPNPLAPDIERLVDAFRSATPRADNIVLFAGHVVRTKGVYELVDACRSIPNVHLKMVGTLFPGIKDELLCRASKQGDTSWIEILGEMPYQVVLQEMMKCAVFVLPTYTEGFPNVILESMACGCPIVATSVGAIPEMLADDAGIVIEPRNVLLLHDAISEVLNNPDKAEQLGVNAARRVRDMYSMPAIWLQMMNLWRNLV